MRGSDPIFIPSTRQLDDIRLLGREWAGVRWACGEERRRIGAKPKDTVYAYLFRDCSGVRVLVAIGRGKAKRHLPMDGIGAFLGELSRRTGASHSDVVVALLLHHHPDAEMLVASQSPLAGACVECACMWQAKSTLVGPAELLRILADEVRDQRERTAAARKRVDKAIARGGRTGGKPLRLNPPNIERVVGV